MRFLTTIVLAIGYILSLQVRAEIVLNTVKIINSNKSDSIKNAQVKLKLNCTKSQKTINNESEYDTLTVIPTKANIIIYSTTTEGINCINITSAESASPTSSLFTFTSENEATVTSTLSPSSMFPVTITNEDTIPSSQKYCASSLCRFYNGTHTNTRPHIACKNSGNFSPACGSQPHLLKMSKRRRNLILDLHNLARSRIASGQEDGFKAASHMPQLKWDNELEYLAELHVKRCTFEHDLCHNTPLFPYSGQNIGYFWKGVNITSHSKRMKNFIVNWYKEHKDANQTFIDSFHLHPDKKVIGHFTAMVSDRIYHVGCAAIRFYESNLTQFLMTCNYDYNNFLGEPVYQSGPPASKCAYKISEKYPQLCDWKMPTYEYELEEDETNSSSNLVFH